MEWFDIIGITGDVLIIGSYLLLQLEKIKSTSLFYSLANGLGAALIIVSLIYNFNFAAFVIEVFWVAISIFGLWKFFRKK